MISIILRNGEEFTTISRLEGSAVTLGEESFSLEKNFSGKSNAYGSEEIGQRRVESTSISLKGDWAATSDEEFYASLSPLVKAFNDALYLKDTELQRVLQVAPEEISIEHERGAFRRSGEVSMKFKRMSPAWEAITSSSLVINIPGSTLTYDMTNFGLTETRSKIVVIPDSSQAISTLEIVSLTPGTNGYDDRVDGVIAIYDPDEDFCPAGRGVVIDNINGLCYTSPIAPGDVTVTDDDRIDIREFIVKGTSFFKHSAGTTAISIICDKDIAVYFEWKQRGLI